MSDSQGQINNINNSNNSTKLRFRHLCVHIFTREKPKQLGEKILWLMTVTLLLNAKQQILYRSLFVGNIHT